MMKRVNSSGSNDVFRWGFVEVDNSDGISNNSNNNMSNWINNNNDNNNTSISSSLISSPPLLQQYPSYPSK